MEELQDAIEDVQYLQAVNSKDSGPSPTEPWPFPSEKELEEFNAERLKTDGKCYALERICSSVLGLYLVRASRSGLNHPFLFGNIALVPNRVAHPECIFFTPFIRSLVRIAGR